MFPSRQGVGKKKEARIVPEYETLHRWRLCTMVPGAYRNTQCI